ncbi:hypothetical protein AB0I72_09380 [Nocardiopsis sp. NPDC049922]|uniref:hypothetical protein n=1 Tax=Nocardiopsis sp. NPDC049922 TaxID=3155157 RepID=UPI0033D35B8E
MVSGNPAAAYLGRSEWLVNGKRGGWAESYHRLIREHGLRHSVAVLTLAEAVRLDPPVTACGQATRSHPHAG